MSLGLRIFAKHNASTPPPKNLGNPFHCHPKRSGNAKNALRRLGGHGYSIAGYRLSGTARYH